MIQIIKKCSFLALSSFIIACGSPSLPSQKKAQKSVIENNFNTTQIGQAIDLSNEENYIYKWTWTDYEGREFTDTIIVSKNEVVAASKKREKITALSPTLPVPDYSIIANENNSFSAILANKLKKVAVERQLTPLDALNMAVSMVQTIPYTLIHNGSHKAIEEYEKNAGGTFIESYHKNENNIPFERKLFGGCQDGVEPCGVYAPAEFASHLRGDCDTRTVFLYVLLKNMGFDVAVANGPGHSMLVTPYVPSNPASPFMLYKGQKYYFWETTVFYNSPGLGRGPRNGDTPRDFDSSKWNIVLI